MIINQDPTNCIRIIAIPMNIIKFSIEEMHVSYDEKIKANIKNLFNTQTLEIISIQIKNC